MAVVCLAALEVACSDDKPAVPTGYPSGIPAQEILIPGAPVMIGTGDIAVCGSNGDEATGALVDSLIKVDSALGVETLVFTAGDNAYPSGDEGLTNDFPRCYAPSWGRKAIMDRIRPSPGNHDYDSGTGDPYFAYFGDRAGPKGRGYYSYDFAGWHAISLNSELYFSRGSPEAAAAQEEWLRQDLQAHRTQCAFAYFHRPLFSSGQHRGTATMITLWKILYDGGVDLVLNGHDHIYERFLPQAPNGARDEARGIEQITVGTGGGNLTPAHEDRARNSAAEIHGHFGVLKLALGNGEYRHAFIDTNHRVWDPGGRKCH